MAIEYPIGEKRPLSSDKEIVYWAPVGGFSATSLSVTRNTRLLRDATSSRLDIDFPNRRSSEAIKTIGI